MVDEKAYFRCRVCQLTFLDPSARLDQAHEKAEYLLHENDPADAGYRAFLSQLVEPLVPRLREGAEGLDYGCGPGPTLSGMLRERGLTVADYDPYFAPDQALLENRYDFVTCTEVVEHFCDPQNEFVRLDRLLKPNGWLGIMTSLLDNDEGFERWHYRRDPTHVVFYKRITFEFLGRRLGWVPEFPARRVVLFRKLD